jgi:hypothetical protein
MTRLKMNPKQSLSQRYLPQPSDAWTWNYAQYPDIDDMVSLTEEQYGYEIDNVFSVDYSIFKYALDISSSHQRHNLTQEQLLVCRDKLTGELLAYSWIGRGHRTAYSNDEMAEQRMATVSHHISPQLRIKLIVQMIYFWETWAKACGVPIVVSNSIRNDHKTFMRVHERLDYVVHGNMAYKRVIPRSTLNA